MHDGRRVSRGQDPDASRASRDQCLIDVVRRLEEGEIVSYGDVAEAAGLPGRARRVGTLLASIVDDVPWWRVVTSDGRLVPGLEREQARRLHAEGVRTSHRRVLAAPYGRFSGRR